MATNNVHSAGRQTIAVTAFIFEKYCNFIKWGKTELPLEILDLFFVETDTFKGTLFVLPATVTFQHFAEKILVPMATSCRNAVERLHVFINNIYEGLIDMESFSFKEILYTEMEHFLKEFTKCIPNIQERIGKIIIYSKKHIQETELQQKIIKFLRYMDLFLQMMPLPNDDHGSNNNENNDKQV